MYWQASALPPTGKPQVNHLSLSLMQSQQLPALRQAAFPRSPCFPASPLMNQSTNQLIVPTHNHLLHVLAHVAAVDVLAQDLHENGRQWTQER